MRKIELDIFRGLMVLCVVIGHCSFSHKLPIDVFWFHMPAFFMISGYLIGVPSQNPLKNKRYLRKSFFRYVLPYFSYSVVLYAVFHPEGILKNMVRTIYAGYNNITIYSYPFWFINTLFVSSIVFSLMLWISTNYKNGRLFLMLIVFLLYIFIHLKSFYPCIYPLPWGLDQMLGALIFIYLGYIYREYEHLILLSIILPIIAIVFFIFTVIYDCSYTLNMQKMEYNNFILDLIVPCTFVMLFYVLSFFIKKLPIVNMFFAEIGKTSMTIFFTHAAMLCLVSDKYPIIKVVLVIILGCIIHHLLRLNDYLSLLFIGKYENSVYKPKS